MNEGLEEFCGMRLGPALFNNKKRETSLAVQWLRLRTSTARGEDSILGQGVKIPFAVQCGHKNT